LDKKNFWSRL